MKYAILPVTTRQTGLLLILTLLSASILANGYFAGIAKRNLSVEKEGNHPASLSEEKISADIYHEPLAQIPEKMEVVPTQVVSVSQNPSTIKESTPVLKENTTYFIKNIRVGEKVFPISVDFEYYKFLKERQPRIFNEKSLEKVFLPRSEVLTNVVEMLRADHEGKRLADALLEFTHNVGYRIDPYNDNFLANNLTQYGAVTIVDGGDCLSLSVLLLNLYYIAGYDAILIQFRDHVVVGIAVDGSGKAVSVGGKKYYIADPANFMRIGSLGQEYAGKSIVRIYRVTPNGSRFTVSVVSEYSWT